MSEAFRGRVRADRLVWGPKAWAWVRWRHREWTAVTLGRDHRAVSHRLVAEREPRRHQLWAVVHVRDRDGVVVSAVTVTVTADTVLQARGVASRELRARGATLWGWWPSRADACAEAERLRAKRQEVAPGPTGSVVAWRAPSIAAPAPVRAVTGVGA